VLNSGKSKNSTNPHKSHCRASVEKCFVKAWSSILEFLSYFLLWFPISGQKQLPTSWSVCCISYVGAKISLKRKSGPFSVRMGGNGWRVYPPCQSFQNNTLSLLLCAQVKYQSLFSQHGFDLLPWFESGCLKKLSVESFQISLSLPSSVKTGPDLAPAPAPGLLGQLLRWSGLSAGSMIHFLSQHHVLELQPRCSRDSRADL